ncbi:DNA-directed RNA polymerase I subunit RPA14 [Kluyveromyces marxianus]|uniref:DNA-directed RNA polymerase I subunit RPA14 n=1 Tax=Kluyveromyces marxianus (strain DMKU3-1042 / BCC 29191 / NBRC 104275) TaxID=1003335 RepID=W0TEB1_KLUMD|nr:DNA-directed RNA polymerase I subunit RPA14 [Kluyveromyces marxianus DMKU3-1042]KAG0672296.1 hypothetical protein C6P43_002146 [Kluyveromyces marxianus]KAG0684800.1 hypothetical protein C6P41_001954 [Kluyveromyces marxianus]BAO41156.1 DNA-directed RNA polymerase I subunit RPA14 [Kluyveromyces marxianus DMKU3-1042]BAP72611.1 DNA-directed RNA polymerase I subunit RPA14 [Kluyveromyces marxianus]
MLRGTRRPAHSTLNTPVVVHQVGTPSYLSKEEVLNFLSTFISEKEAIPAVSLASRAESVTQTSITSGGVSTEEVALDTQLSSALAQLKRVERDFKGLPPQVLETEPSSSNTAQKTTPDVDTVEKSATGGKKIKFADESEPSETVNASGASKDTSDSSSSDSSSSDSE